MRKMQIPGFPNEKGNMATNVASDKKSPLFRTGDQITLDEVERIVIGLANRNLVIIISYPIPCDLRVCSMFFHAGTGKPPACGRGKSLGTRSGVSHG
jgi:hypothetical protein